jgi:hypothetical protein
MDPNALVNPAPRPPWPRDWTWAVMLAVGVFGAHATMPWWMPALAQALFGNIPTPADAPPLLWALLAGYLILSLAGGQALASLARSTAHRTVHFTHAPSNSHTHGGSRMHAHPHHPRRVRCSQPGPQAWWPWALTWRMTLAAALLWTWMAPHLTQAKTFHCRATDTPCLIASMIEANTNGQQENDIRLEGV